MHKLALILIFLPALALGADYKLVKCEGIPLPKEVNVKECPNGSPCNFHDSQIITVSFTIQLDHPVTSLPYRIWFVTENLVDHVYPLEHTDVCEKIKGCPLQPGDYTVTDTFDLKNFPANEDIILGGMISDQDNAEIACFTHKLRLQV